MRAATDTGGRWESLPGRIVDCAEYHARATLSSAAREGLEDVVGDLLRLLANWPTALPPRDVWKTMRHHWRDRPWLAGLLQPLPLSARRMLLGVDRRGQEAYRSVIEYAIDPTRAEPPTDLTAIWRRALADLDR